MSRKKKTSRNSASLFFFLFVFARSFLLSRVLVFVALSSNAMARTKRVRLMHDQDNSSSSERVAISFSEDKHEREREGEQTSKCRWRPFVFFSSTHLFFLFVNSYDKKQIPTAQEAHARPGDCRWRQEGRAEDFCVLAREARGTFSVCFLKKNTWSRRTTTDLFSLCFFSHDTARAFCFDRS